MQYQDKESPLIVIIGPTAVGKTDIAIEIAEHFQGEIISADSRLLYVGMDIGTAKPTLEEQRGVPHHLIDVARPDEVWSLALYQKATYEVISDLHKKNILPIMAGGTGQYIHAVTEGWQIPAQEPDDDLREVLEAWAKDIGSEEMYLRLQLVDRAAADKIEPNNVRRTVRALEVIFRTGKKFSEQRTKTRPPYSILKIGLIRPRDILYARIDARIEKMLQDGFLDEVKVLLNEGYSPEHSALSAIGYREMIAYLQSKMTMDEAVAQMKKLTRQFVRRQANWFKESAEDICWFDLESASSEDIISFIESGEGWLTE